MEVVVLVLLLLHLVVCAQDLEGSEIGEGCLGQGVKVGRRLAGDGTNLSLVSFGDGLGERGEIITNGC